MMAIPVLFRPGRLGRWVLLELLRLWLWGSGRLRALQAWRSAWGGLGERRPGGRPVRPRRPNTNWRRSLTHQAAA